MPLTSPFAPPGHLTARTLLCYPLLFLCALPPHLPPPGKRHSCFKTWLEVYLLHEATASALATLFLLSANSQGSKASLGDCTMHHWAVIVQLPGSKLLKDKTPKGWHSVEEETDINPHINIDFKRALVGTGEDTWVAQWLGLPWAQVMILRSCDRVPHWACCMEPASSSAYVSASVCVCVS